VPSSRWRIRGACDGLHVVGWGGVGWRAGDGAAGGVQAVGAGGLCFREATLTWLSSTPNTHAQAFPFWSPPMVCACLALQRACPPSVRPLWICCWAPTAPQSRRGVWPPCRWVGRLSGLAAGRGAGGADMHQLAPAGRGGECRMQRGMQPWPARRGRPGSGGQGCTTRTALRRHTAAQLAWPYPSLTLATVFCHSAGFPGWCRA